MGIIQCVRAKRLGLPMPQPVGVDAGLDNDMRDMDILGAQFARGRLCNGPQAELGAGEGRISRPTAKARCRTGEEDIALAPGEHRARERAPKNIHVAHLIIDSGVDTEWVRQRRIEALGPGALDNPDLLMPPSSVAESYWLLYQQPRSAWTFELEIRPFGEKW